MHDDPLSLFDPIIRQMAERSASFPLKPAIEQLDMENKENT